MMHQRVDARQAEPTRKIIRHCPDDFVETYLRIGWDGIELHYRAHKDTIKRWVMECGGDDLKARRAAVVAEKRKSATPTAVPVKRSTVEPELARSAAQFLRTRQGGRWVVTMVHEGEPTSEWRVGSVRMSAAHMIRTAEGKGFDRKQRARFMPPPAGNPCAVKGWRGRR